MEVRVPIVIVHICCRSKVEKQPTLCNQQGSFSGQYVVVRFEPQKRGRTAWTTLMQGSKAILSPLADLALH